MAYLFLIAVLVFRGASSDGTLPGVVAGYSLYLVLFAGIATYAWWNNRRDLRLAEKKSPAVPLQAKLAIYRGARLLAALMERVGSERLLEKEIPDNIVIITRRVILDELRSKGLLDGLKGPILELLFAPDGHWEENQKKCVETMWEYLAVLRWSLGLGDLLPLSLSPEYSLTMARDIAATRQPEKLEVLASWDMRPERNQTHEFFLRCSLELQARGKTEAISFENVDHALRIRDEYVAEVGPSDFLVGTETIGELEDGPLWTACLRSYRRLKIVNLLVNITTGDEPPEEFIKMLSGELAVAEPVTSQ